MMKPSVRQAGTTSSAWTAANPVNVNVATAITRMIFIGSIPV
jgi:hypothetical protein